MNENIIVREVKIGLVGDVNITSEYKNVTLSVGEGYEVNYLKNKYPDYFEKIKEILKKGNIIYEVYKYRDKNRLSFVGLMSVDELNEIKVE